MVDHKVINHRVINDRALQNIYAVIVVGLLVWPLPHYFLTQSIVSDPWKNLGLAMYATDFEIGVRVDYRKENMKWQEMIEDETSALLIRQFIEQRRTRGIWAEPDRLAAELRTLTHAKEMRILVGSRMLNGRTGQMQRVHRKRYSYEFP